MSPKHLATGIVATAVLGSFIKSSAGESRFSGVFVISDITVSKDEPYQRYRQAVKPLIESCGGTYVVRAGAKFVTDNPTTALVSTSGGWNPDRIIVLHFDTAEQATACFNSPEYEAVYALREGGTSSKSLVVNAYRPDD